MTYVLYILAALLVFDAIRMRGRLGALAVLAPSDEPATHVAIGAPGVDLAPATLRAASAYARDKGVDVVDLVPRDLPAIRAMTLAQLVDPSKYRADRIAPGRTAGHAIAISADVAHRVGAPTPTDPIEFARLAVKLKHYGKADIAIAVGESARPQDPRDRFEILRAQVGPSTAMALAALPILWALIGYGMSVSPTAGLVALAAWQLQPLLALAGGPIKSRDLLTTTLFRFPIELVLLVRTLWSRRLIQPAADYQGLIARSSTFWEPRRETCPLCESRDLRVQLRCSDMFQHKPGTFTLERCTSCGHVFQNPRLSLAGLDFYYKDFYDGLGETGMEFIFAFGAEPYHARARMVREVATPKRWLDVGGGHGHFCIAARDDLPETKFDGLDLSESIEEAKRRGWVDTAYRGLFPELAPSIAGRYDAVSMSHYLEHTLDPRAEIDAARTALAPAGHLLIEVPDPEFGLGRVLGRFWLPWFQPQHQHLLSVKNLERLLRERGFTPLVWHRGAAHQRVDFFFASWLLLDRIAPSPSLPWRKRGALAAAWRVAVWTIGAPFVILAIVIDNAIGPLLSRAKVSNTYRVVAKKE